LFERPRWSNVGRLRHQLYVVISVLMLGAPLARVEGEIAFSTLLRRFQTLRLETETLEWTPSQVFRGLRELPVTFV